MTRWTNPREQIGGAQFLNSSEFLYFSLPCFLRRKALEFRIIIKSCFNILYNLLLIITNKLFRYVTLRHFVFSNLESFWNFKTKKNLLSEKNEKEAEKHQILKRSVVPQPRVVKLVKRWMEKFLPLLPFPPGLFPVLFIQCPAFIGRATFFLYIKK